MDIFSVLHALFYERPSYCYAIDEECNILWQNHEEIPMGLTKATLRDALNEYPVHKDYVCQLSDGEHGCSIDLIDDDEKLIYFVEITAHNITESFYDNAAARDYLMMNSLLTREAVISIDDELSQINELPLGEYSKEVREHINESMMMCYDLLRRVTVESDYITTNKVCQELRSLTGAMRDVISAIRETPDFPFTIKESICESLWVFASDAMLDDVIVLALLYVINRNPNRSVIHMTLRSEGNLARLSCRPAEGIHDNDERRLEWIRPVTELARHKSVDDIGMLNRIVKKLQGRIVLERNDAGVGICLMIPAVENHIFALHNDIPFDKQSKFGRTRLILSERIKFLHF